MDVLGLNAYHADSAAVLLRGGKIEIAVEEERLNRVKHWAGFPIQALKTVLGVAGSALSEVAHVAISRDPKAHLLQKILFTFRHRPGIDAIRDRLANHREIEDIRTLLTRAAGDSFTGIVHKVEHHRAHLASAFFCSPFEEAACLTVDGFGDFLSSMSAVGRWNELFITDEVMFPHSLGIAYTAVTQFLGFPRYGDEYKVMGLAAYGEPRFLPQMRRIVRLSEDGSYETDPDYFMHTSDGVTMSWESGEPVIGPLWSRRFEEEFGPPRHPDDDVTDRDRDLAASLQASYEETFFHRLRWLQRRTGLKALCLAGGCALNSVANGKILKETGFRDVFVQPAAGDAGTALGAAHYVWHQVLGHRRDFVMLHSYWGPEYPESRIVTALREKVPGFGSDGGDAELGDKRVRARRYETEGALVKETAAALARGNIVGWYQGRSEWGPRALGNRSILADPRRAEMKDILNARVKRRESFRPFAPSILEEHVGEFFAESYPDPFMLKVYPIRPEKRGEIPAVTHVDGTGRLQTVSREQNPRYWALIRAFQEITSVPVILNTSFNENEPIVNTPEEAVDCFLRTEMDQLVLGEWVLERLGEKSR